MLEKLEFVNYRCFKKSEIKFRELVIIVGKNNAGKSTIVEALRLISLVSQKASRTIYSPLPSEFNMEKNCFGFKLDVDKLKIDLNNIVYFYSDDIAKITATFINGVKIQIFLNSECAYGALIDENGDYIKQRSRVSTLKISNVEILPQISLLREKETRLSDETIVDDKDSYLCSRHFRNELFYYKDKYFNDFKRLAEESWDDLKIDTIRYNYEVQQMELFVEDLRFPAEVGAMGSGLQMWLQIIWFISRTDKDSIIILDEPDTYMHPDLQLKLLNLVKERCEQIIIATHSIEIISQVSPQNIVSIDRKNKIMRYANDSKAVQSIIDNIGGVQNLSLLRIGYCKKCVFVEGEDLFFLKKFYNVLFNDKDNIFEMLPVIPLGGWPNLQRAYGASNLFYNETNNCIVCYGILDSDYYTDDQIAAKMSEAELNHLNLFVFKRKEIENYLIIPSLLYRIAKPKKVDFESFTKKLDNILDAFQEEIEDDYSTQYKKYSNNKLEINTCNKWARGFVRSKWIDLDSKIALVSGKKALSTIIGWLKSEYKVSCSITQIFNHMRIEDVPAEIVELISFIKK